MKVWYNKVNESRRSMVETAADEVFIGRDADNTVVLRSPLVSRRHAVVRPVNGQLLLENIGLNSCVVGDTEILGGERVEFEPGAKVRIWPFTLTFETEKAATVSQSELDAHLRAVMAQLELRIHRKLLERLDLYELENNRVSNRDNILLLENNIDDACRELDVFGEANEALLEEISGLTLRDHLINQLIMETNHDDFFDLASLTSNEFDVPATLVPERETELHSLLQFLRERLELSNLPDTSSQIHCVEKKFSDVFHLVRPHLHKELRRYLIGRTLKKDLKDTVFGYGPLQDLLRAPTVTEIMVVSSDQIYVERGGVIEKSGRRFISDKVTESDHRTDRVPGRAANRQEPAAGRCPLARRLARQRHHSAAGHAGPLPDDSQVPLAAAHDGRLARVRQPDRQRRAVPAGSRHRPPQRAGQRRHRHRQNHAAERAERVHSAQGTHRHH